MASFTYIKYDETVPPSGKVPDNEEETNSDEKSTSTSGLGTQYYVRLRDLLGFLENGSSGISSIIPKIKNRGGEESALRFNYSVDQNLMWLDPFQVSTDPLKCVINKNISFDGYNHAFGVSDMEPFEITKGNYTYGQILNIYINCVYIIDIIKTNTGDDGKIDLYTFLEKILEGINASFSGLNNLTIFIDETTNEILFVDQNPLPGRENLITNKQTTKFRMFGYKGGENSFVKDFDFKTEITPQLATMITVGAAANNTVVGADATAISYLNAGLTDRFKTSMYNDVTIHTNVTIPEKIKRLPEGGAPAPKPGEGKSPWIEGQTGFIEEIKRREEESAATTELATLDKMWDQYKDFLKKISTSIDNDEFAEDARSATKELIDENRSKLKDLMQYANNANNIKNIDVLREKINDNISPWKNVLEQANIIQTTYVEDVFKVGSISNFTGFIPFNLGLTIDGLSGMKINQKFTVDTDFLPTNYPSTVEFLIKNISHEISNNKWYTKLESYCISKGGSGQSSTRKYNTSVGNVSTSGGKIQTSGASSTPSIPVGVEDADIIQKAIAIGEFTDWRAADFGVKIKESTTIDEYLDYMRTTVEGGYGHPLMKLDAKIALGEDYPSGAHDKFWYKKAFVDRLGTDKANMFEDVGCKVFNQGEFVDNKGKIDTRINWQGTSTDSCKRVLNTSLRKSLDIIGSGETMYGMDRSQGGWGNAVETLRKGGKVGAGMDEVKNELIEFWDTIDKYSGYGKFKIYSNTHNTAKWNAVKYNVGSAKTWPDNYGYDPNKYTGEERKVVEKLIELKKKIYTSTNTHSIRYYLKQAAKGTNFDSTKLYDEIMNNGLTMSYFVRYTVNGPKLVQFATKRWVQQYNTYMKGDKNDIYKLLADNIIYMFDGFYDLRGSITATKLAIGFFPAGKSFKGKPLKNILGQ